LASFELVIGLRPIYTSLTILYLFLLGALREILSNTHPTTDADYPLED